MTFCQFVSLGFGFGGGRQLTLPEILESGLDFGVLLLVSMAQRTSWSSSCFWLSPCGSSSSWMLLPSLLLPTAKARQTETKVSMSEALMEQVGQAGDGVGLLGVWGLQVGWVDVR